MPGLSGIAKPESSSLQGEAEAILYKGKKILAIKDGRD